VKWLALAALIIVVDQLTKTLIVGWFEHGDSRPVTDFFNLVRAHNKGAAFHSWPTPGDGSAGSS
jgi:signal peptidase II